METMTPTPPPTMLTVADLAKALQVDPITIRRWIASGKLPAVKLGKSYRIHPDALTDLLKGSTQ